MKRFSKAIFVYRVDQHRSHADAHDWHSIGDREGDLNRTIFDVKAMPTIHRIHMYVSIYRWFLHDAMTNL